MLKQLRNIFTRLLPSACVLCGNNSGQITNLCEACRQELPWLIGVCESCAVPLPAATPTSQFCGECLQQALPFTRVYALCRYEEPIDRLITALKFKHQLVYARLLGELLVERLQADWYQYEKLPECLIPVPLHAQRLRERGFNQAIELARPIVKKIKIPLNIDACQRVRATQTQMALPATERQNNVKKAFAVNIKFNAKHVAILDDVMTTGHTIRELSKALRKVGVERIDIWCCARTILPAHSPKVI